MLREKRSGGAGRGFGRRWGMGYSRVETGEYGAWGREGEKLGGQGKCSLAIEHERVSDVMTPEIRRHVRGQREEG